MLNTIQVNNEKIENTDELGKIGKKVNEYNKYLLSIAW